MIFKSEMITFLGVLSDRMVVLGLRGIWALVLGFILITQSEKKSHKKDRLTKTRRIYLKPSLYHFSHSHLYINCIPQLMSEKHYCKISFLTHSTSADSN